MNRNANRRRGVAGRGGSARVAEYRRIGCKKAMPQIIYHRRDLCMAGVYFNRGH